MRRTAVITLIGGMALLPAFVGMAPAVTRHEASGFDGSCSVKGTVGFNPPVTNTQQRLTVTYNATGSCSGTLDGRGVSDAHVRLHHRGHSEGSCLGAHTIAPGRGRITFADGTVIPYAFEFQATGTEVDFSFTGRQSGAASGHGTFLTTRTPADAALKCAGSGNRTLPMDMSLATTSAMAGKNR